MEIKNIIKSRRQELGLTLEQLGDMVGVSKSTVRKWETGYIANMRRDKIAKLAEALGVRPTDFIGDDYLEDTSTVPNNISPIELHKIPLIGTIACGEPVYADQEYESYVAAGSDVKADCCLRAAGDSMIGARILDGDIVFIRQQPMVDNGEIAAVIIDEEATLKRVYYDKKRGILQLVAENPAYAPMIYSGEELEKVRILGKAIAFQSDVK